MLSPPRNTQTVQKQVLEPAAPRDTAGPRGATLRPPVRPAVAAGWGRGRRATGARGGPGRGRGRGEGGVAASRPLSGRGLPARPSRLLDSAHAGALAARIPEPRGPRGAGPGRPADAEDARGGTCGAVASRRRRPRRGGRGRGAACALPARAVPGRGRPPSLPPSLSPPPGAAQLSAPSPLTSYLSPPAPAPPHFARAPSGAHMRSRACARDSRSPLADAGPNDSPGREDVGRGGEQSVTLGQSPEYSTGAFNRVYLTGYISKNTHRTPVFSVL